jgi:hypothetical protein
MSCIQSGRTLGDAVRAAFSRCARAHQQIHALTTTWAGIGIMYWHTLYCQRSRRILQLGRESPKAGLGASVKILNYNPLGNLARSLLS